jgi:hypothetical protein
MPADFAALTAPPQIALPRRGRAAAVFGLLLISLTFHLSALSGWWLTDDPQVLVQAERYRPREYFFVPQAWRYLSSSNFTPLVTLSFEADLKLAGLQPRAFYAHQIASLTLAAILLFLYLAPWTGSLLAFLAAAMFLGSPQAIVAARTLMVRHYVEGLAFALLALLAWRAGRSRRPATYSLIAATAYLMAILAKEIYLGVPLFMILESGGAGERWRKVSARFLPVVAATIGYGIWRVRMLETVGGYGESLRPADLMTLGGGAIRLLLGSVGPEILVTFGAAALVVLILATFNQPKASLWFLAIALLVLVAPLLAVARQLEMRHLFAAFVVVSAGIALGVGLTRRGGRLATVAAAVALIVTLVGGQMVRRQHEEGSSHVVAEGRYVWTQSAGAKPILAAAPGWYLDGLVELRTRQGGGPGPRFLLSDEALLVEDTDPREVVTVERTNGTRIGPLDPALVHQIREEKSRFDPQAFLSVHMERDDHRLRWQLGPQPSSRWTFLSYPDYDEYEIPPAGSRIIPEPTERQSFRILRHLPDGRWTVSPPLGLPDPGQSVRWQQP